MYLIHVTARFDAEPERVFDVLADHETFFSFGSATCRLVEEGKGDRNGLGAVREIRDRQMVFREEITVFDRPRRFDYVIRSLTGPLGLPLPVEHERGWLEFHAEDGSTRVDWRSRFRITLPLVGPLLERRVGPSFADAFGRLLEAARARL